MSATYFISTANLQQFSDGLKTKYLMVSNLTTALDEHSTDAQVPSAKSVYDFVTETFGDIERVQLREVDELPATGESNAIYLVLVPGGSSETYSMHLWADDRWVNLGNMEVDLSGYWKKEDLVEATSEQINEILNNI